jgi:hypothetical protein
MLLRSSRKKLFETLRSHVHNRTFGSMAKSNLNIDQRLSAVDPTKYLKSYKGKSYNYEIKFEQEPTEQNLKNILHKSVINKLTFTEVLFNDFEKILRKVNPDENNTTKLFTVNCEQKFKWVQDKKELDLMCLEPIPLNTATDEKVYYEVELRNKINLIALSEILKNRVDGENIFERCFVVEENKITKVYIPENNIDKFIDAFCIGTKKYISRTDVYDSKGTSGNTFISGFSSYTL